MGQVLLQAIDSGDLDLALTLGGAQKKTARLLSEPPIGSRARFQRSHTAAVTACSFQPPMRMSDTGAGGTGKSWTHLARRNDEP